MSNQDYDQAFDPRLSSDSIIRDDEQLFEKEFRELTFEDKLFFGLRCGAIFLFLIGFIIVIVNFCRGNRLKCWRMYIVCSLMLYCWLGLTLYHDHIDIHWVQEIVERGQRESIYWCFRNLTHGLTLYLIILLLSHLSDFQHDIKWLIMVFCVVLVPLLFSVVILVVDLRVHPDDRHAWPANIGVQATRVFLYNIVTTILLFCFAGRFCTRRLFGTYEEKRSPLVILAARWTFSFLLLHNLCAIAGFVVNVFLTLAIPQSLDIDINLFTTVHKSLAEADFYLIVLAIPFSYVIGVLAQCCCYRSGSAGDVELDHMNKIYQEVWSTQENVDRHQKRSERNGVSALPEPTSSSNNGVKRRENSKEMTTAEKRRNRNSYMEAVSMGSSLDGSRLSLASSQVTTEPIDL